MAVTRLNLIGDFATFFGAPATGHVVVTPRAVVRNDADQVLMEPVPLVSELTDGAMEPVSVVCSDSADVTPTGFTYRIEIHIDGAGRKKFNLAVPVSAAPELDLTTCVALDGNQELVFPDPDLVAIGAHENDSSDAHDASAVSYTPEGDITATDVQEAVQQAAALGSGGSGGGTWGEITGALGDQSDLADALAAKATTAALATEVTTARAAETANGTAIANEATTARAAETSKLPLAGGTLAGPLVLPGNAATALQATPLQQVQSLIAALVNAAPGTLDTLKELADALGDDPNFATTITALIGTKETPAGAQAKVDSHAVAGDPHTGYQKESEKNQGGGYVGLSSTPGVPDGGKFLRDDGTWQPGGLPSSYSVALNRYSDPLTAVRIAGFAGNLWLGPLGPGATLPINFVAGSDIHVEYVESATNATASPAAVAAIASVPSPAISTGATVIALTVAALATVPAPSIQTPSGTTTSPAAVAAIASVPSPAISTGATVIALTVAALATVPAPSVQTPSGATPFTGRLGTANSRGGVLVGAAA